MLTPEQIAKATRCSPEAAHVWLPVLEQAMQEFGVDMLRRQASFLAAVGHESRNLTQLRESMNYKPAGIIGTFRHHFTPEQAERYGRTPAHPADQIAIANIAYNGRMGNRPGSDDGWNFRGGGPGQLTGRSNYAACGKALGIDLIGNPSLIVQPAIGARAFGWFWREGNKTGQSLNNFVDRKDMFGLTEAINGGAIGLSDRIERDLDACKALGVKP